MGNQQMTVSNQSAQSTAVAKYGDDQEITLLMTQVRRAIPGGMKLQDHEVKALVIASKFSGLDVFAGEIYYIPNTGVMIATKVIIADAVAAAAKRGASIIVDFQPIKPGTPEGDAMKLLPADVAWACIVTDSQKRQRWFNERLQLIDSYKRMGFPPKEVLDLVQVDMGNRPPTVVAVGVVNGSELFGDAKAEAKYSRDDRAKKRACKKAFNLAGYASTTEARRNFGGVPIAQDDSIEAEYHEVTRPVAEQAAAPDEGELSAAVASHIAETAPIQPAQPKQEQPAPKVERVQVDSEMAAIQRHVDNATRALAGNGYPTSKSEAVIWTLVKTKATVMGFTSDELAKFSPGKDPHVTTLLHSVKALGAAIIARAGQQAIEPEPASEQDVIEVEENQTTLI